MRFVQIVRYRTVLCRLDVIKKRRPPQRSKNSENLVDADPRCGIVAGSAIICLFLNDVVTAERSSLGAHLSTRPVLLQPSASVQTIRTDGDVRNNTERLGDWIYI